MKKMIALIGFIGWWGLVAGQGLLTLDDCRRQAMEHNKDIQVAQLSLEAAHQYKNAAFMQFFPTISAVGSYAWNEKNISLLAEDALLPVGSKMSDGSFGFTPSQISNSWTMIGGQPVPLDASGQPFDPAADPDKIQWKEYAYLPKEAMEFDTRNIFAGGISLVQPVYMGGKIRELYRMSKYAEQIAMAKQDGKTAEIMVEVDEAYWRVVSLQNKVQLAKKYRDLIVQMDTNMSALLAEGQATASESLKVKVKLNEAEMSLVKAENGLSLSRRALNQLCGRPLDDKTPLAGLDEKGPEAEIMMGTVQEAIANRPEIKTLEQLENIACSNKRLAVSRFLPNIGITGNYLLSNPNMYNGYSKEFSGMFNVGVVATIPICHFGDRIYTLNAAKAEQKIAALKLEDAREKIELQFNQSAYRINESVKKQLATQRNVEMAEENLRMATEGFDAGIVTSTDMMAAQTAWLTAHSENIDAIIDVKLSRLYLQKTMGTLASPVPANPGK